MLSLQLDRSAHIARRQKLQTRAGAGPLLFASGTFSPRNYRASPYPFRAASHFLYLVGVPFHDAFLLIDGDEHTLFTEEQTAADALWHGPSPSFAQITQATGLKVAAIDTLAARLQGKNARTLAAVDWQSCAWQSKLLGRSISPSTVAPEDETLADAMISLRLIHDEAAQREMRAAAAITVKAHMAGMQITKPGIHEHDVRGAMEAPIWSANGAPAYGSIVTVHGEVLHNNAYHHALAHGDLLLADVGAESPTGWASDVTRTWPVTGHFSPTQRALYDVVLDAQRAAISAVRPGVRYADVHRIACEVLARGLVDLKILRGDPRELVADGVHALLFPHGVGHLIGMDVHDMEDLGDRAGYAPGRERSKQFGLSYLRLDRDLVEGMAVTIEPGIYLVPAILDNPELSKIGKDRLNRTELAKFKDVRGIRIEDDVLVTAHGCEVLTQAIPKAPDAVQAAVGDA